MPIENFGSSSVIVPVPLAVAIPMPPVALLSVTITLSPAPSSVLSPATVTVIFLLVSVAPNVSGLLGENVKSVPEVAPPEKAKATVDD